MLSTIVIREDQRKYTDHDRLFKELIRTFFAEFLEVFFPHIHEQIDFSYMKLLSEEVFTDVTIGEKRRVDILMETKLRGKNTIIIIHVEPQSYSQTKFHERMFIYFSRLYETHRKPILPIAVFSYDENRKEPSTFSISFPFQHVLTFQFLKLQLRQMNWRTFIYSNNPVAAALLSKMDYTAKERIQVKMEFLRMLVRMELNPAKMALINGFFETYLQLDHKEEKILMEEIKQLQPVETEGILQLPNSWIEKGFNKGLQEGRKKGMKEGRKEGKREGIQEGIREGMENSSKRIAYNMLKKGFPEEVIVNITELSIEKVKKIKKELD
ncbi:Rpn family recombination-promoting nuclease/putative transposase [Bacillus chungangensis]|uniref:Transposase (putative) YhgA-like domain-containing protein n=1 Tax=Bacillus chungangensis TaxID=587633 RepID=A0ABT9WXI3_9BACI|nr:Rpn family recombination-promoting nuclease/putative transposase [Bacillus chungangensis]MDQ0178000.1 hypothetical protein [Bacillus chungangensis]